MIATIIPPIRPRVELMLPEGAIVGVAVGISVGGMPEATVGIGVAVATAPIILIC